MADRTNNNQFNENNSELSLKKIVVNNSIGNTNFEKYKANVEKAYNDNIEELFRVKVTAQDELNAYGRKQLRGFLSNVPKIIDGSIGSALGASGAVIGAVFSEKFQKKCVEYMKKELALTVSAATGIINSVTSLVTDPVRFVYYKVTEGDLSKVITQNGKATLESETVKPNFDINEFLSKEVSLVQEQSNEKIEQLKLDIEKHEQVSKSAGMRQIRLNDIRLLDDAERNYQGKSETLEIINSVAANDVNANVIELVEGEKATIINKGTFVESIESKSNLSEVAKENANSAADESKGKFAAREISKKNDAVIVTFTVR